ncbi:hypothetical protein C8A03DRAFT_48072 [Achaetomium macrosporum]|uniref:Uncharacterized protein n=1 Tax=Achaetomium macrosporum TaxID=79813 RepID=A0AAN7H9W0_9PEZI|nr:hypothetical protein C8A03DRAFT_48072 [Achaetomium macrosporum]
MSSSCNLNSVDDPARELLAAAHNKVKSCSVSAGKNVDAASDESDAPEPSVTIRPGPDDEFAKQQQRRGSLGPFLEPLSSSPETVHATQTQPLLAGCAAFLPGQASTPDNTSRDTTVPETDAASLAEHGATRHGHGMQHGPQPSEKPCGTTSNHDGSICLDNESWDRLTPGAPAETRASTPTLPNADGISELELVDAEPRLRLHSPGSAAPSLEAETQQRSDSCCLSHHHHRGDSVRTSDPEHRHPQVPDDGGEQDEESSVVPPQAQESRPGMPSLSGNESGNEHELANTEPSMQPPADQGQANLQHNIRCPRRCNTDDEEGLLSHCGNRHQGKRRRVNPSAPTTRRTVPKRQTRPHQRSSTRQQCLRVPALEEETVEAGFASFEEWPLEAVLKRVWSTAGRTSSTERAYPPKVTSTAKVQDAAGYFEVEEILNSRQREG